MNSVFKSEQGRDQIRAYYNQILSFFPYAKGYADTSFGQTFYLEAGNAQNPAVILLHGSCSNSAAWLGDIPVLAERYHVYAVDIPGEAGHSQETRPKLRQYPLWLNELMDTLKIPKAILIGNSLGGWLALHFAAAYPKRISSLVLIASSGIVSIKPSFLKTTDQLLSDGTPNAAPLIDAALEGVPKEVRGFMMLIFEHFNPITGEMPVLTDEQMRSLMMPVLLIAGEKDFTMDAPKAAERLKSLVVHAKIHLIENGSHVIMDTMKTVIPFIQGKA